MKKLIMAILILSLAIGSVCMVRAITNKALGVKPPSKQPSLTTYNVSASQILPIEDTNQIPQAVIQQAVASFTQSVYTPVQPNRGYAPGGVVYPNVSAASLRRYR